MYKSVAECLNAVTVAVVENCICQPVRITLLYLKYSEQFQSNAFSFVLHLASDRLRQTTRFSKIIFLTEGEESYCCLPSRQKKREREKEELISRLRERERAGEREGEKRVRVGSCSAKKKAWANSTNL